MKINDVNIFVVHTEERQSMLVNTETGEKAMKIVEEYGYTPTAYVNVFIPSNDLRSIENIMM